LGPITPPTPTPPPFEQNGVGSCKCDRPNIQQEMQENPTALPYPQPKRDES